MQTPQPTSITHLGDKEIVFVANKIDGMILQTAKGMDDSDRGGMGKTMRLELLDIIFTFSLSLMAHRQYALRVYMRSEWKPQPGVTLDVFNRYLSMVFEVILMDFKVPDYPCLRYVPRIHWTDHIDATSPGTMDSDVPDRDEDEEEEEEEEEEGTLVFP